MRYSNKLAVKWLLAHDFDEIWLKRHTKRHDIHYTQKGNYVALDLWKLFDGITIDKTGKCVFLQLNTFAWPSDNILSAWLMIKTGISVMAINVKRVKKKWVVFNRYYHRTNDGVGRIAL